MASLMVLLALWISKPLTLTMASLATSLSGSFGASANNRDKPALSPVSPSASTESARFTDTALAAPVFRAGERQVRTVLVGDQCGAHALVVRRRR